MNSLFKSLAVASLAFISTNLAFAGPWPGFGRTMPISRYEKDEGYDPNYRFGNFRTFMGYHDPDFLVGLSVPSPMNNPEYQSYNVIITINDNETMDKSDVYGPPQTMRVYSRSADNNKKLLYFWNISTGMATNATRKGYFRPQSFSSRHWSGAYDAPMLSSVFFDGGKALHSSMARSDYDDMGVRRSSHGCVHVEDNRAEELFHLIGHSGYGSVDVIGRNGKRILDSNGKAQKANSYKTLIIVY